MKKPCILGLGNRLMMDDGIGLYVVEELQRRDTTNHFHYVIGETDLDYCIDICASSGYLVIIDAVDLGKKPGETTVMTLSKLNPDLYQGSSMHEQHLFHWISLHKNDINGVLIGIELYKIDFCFGLSRPLVDVFEEIVTRVQNIIEDVLNSHD